ncbi:serine-rich adhesin platelet-type [Gracilaria domingensis]|nr:serine-rich adhesin platelet-type [Gracilaria domingensis]
MASEKEDAVEKVVQPEQTDDPHAHSAQPDMDPGVIDVEEEAIDVDAVDEEENEGKSSSDEKENGVDLLSSSSAAVGQADVDVIDLEEADVDGEDGGVNEEGNRGDDFLRDNADEDGNKEQENVKDEMEESVTRRDEGQKDEEDLGPGKQEEARRTASEKEADDKQREQSSVREEAQPPVEGSIVNPGLQIHPVADLKDEVNEGEAVELSTPPPGETEGVRDAGDLRAEGEEHEKGHASPRGDSKNESTAEEDQPAEETIKAADNVSQHVDRAASRGSTPPENESDAHQDGVQTSEAIPDVVTTSANDATGTGMQENKKDSDENVESQAISDADSAAPESIANRDNATKSEATEPEMTKDDISPTVASMKEANTMESSEPKPGVTMDLEVTEEEEHEDAVEEEAENMDEENTNADMELSEEEPAHDIQADVEHEPEPPASINDIGAEVAAKTGTGHEISDVPTGEDAIREPQDLGRLENVTAMEVDETFEGREEDNASRTPAKESENLKPSGFAEGIDVQKSTTTDGVDANAAKHSDTDAPGTMDTSLSADGGKEVSPSISEKKESDIVSSESPDDPGGSTSANLTAPLFGMRPSGFPAQPVSFRTPPSFQRTSLSPNARPFIPAAHREAMRKAALSSTQSNDGVASAALPESIDKEDMRETPGAGAGADVHDTNENEERKLLFSPQEAAEQLQPSVAAEPSQESVMGSSASAFSAEPAKQSTKQEDVESAETHQPVSADQPPLPVKESKLISARKALALKVKKDSIVKPSSKSQGKKVTFSLSDTKVTVPIEAQVAPTPSESSAGGTSESGQEGKLEEQKLKEEKSDDGFMYEVSHVPLSVRIGNGNAIKRGSLSTLRLTVAKSGEAKLDMFKEGASSLLLFESLSASRNILRVRKVSNRPIMTVTLMSNNNGGTQVAKKYYVHLGYHLYEKVFKACVAHLNSTSPDRRTGADPSASAASMTKRLSTPVGSDGEDVQASGTKRSSDGARPADPKRFKAPDRRRELLEAKAKLLENLKAARKNKASSGIGETERGPDKTIPVAPTLSGIAALPSTSKPPTGQVVPKTPQQMTSKAGAPKSAIAFGASVPVKTLEQGTKKTKHSEPVVHTPAVLSGKRKQLADKHARSGRQKEASENKVQTELPREGGATSNGGPLPPSTSALKRKKPAGSLSVQKHAPGKRPFEEVKPTDSKRLRTTNEKSASIVGTPSATQEKLKALREQAKTGMGASSKSRTAANSASASKMQAIRPSVEELEEVKQAKAMVANLLKDKTDAAKQAAAVEREKRKILEDLDRLKKALSKANGETAESKREVAKLIEEHNAAEKRLGSTMAALEKSKQEQEELWTKLSLMLTIVKAAQESEANDEGNEEKKKISLNRCDHDNVEDFFYRLRTFRPSTWPVEEADIGALACARHGWYNSGVNELKSSDGVTLLLGDLFEDCESYMARIDEMKTALVQKHALLSGWRGKQCARDIGKELLSREVLMNNASKLKELVAEKRVRGFNETSKNVCELAAACGWKGCEAGVQCEWCGVVVGEELHLRESHYQFCIFFREEMEVRRNAELLGLDWEVEGARLGLFFRSTYGDVMDERGLNKCSSCKTSWGRRSAEDDVAREWALEEELAWMTNQIGGTLLVRARVHATVTLDQSLRDTPLCAPFSAMICRRLNARPAAR